MAHKLADLEADDPVRRKQEELLLEKCFDMGIIGTGGGGKGKLSDIERLSVSAFARRRLAVVMTRLQMADTVQAAIRFIEQGHVRCGPEVVTDPAFMVSRLAIPTYVQGASLTKNRTREDHVTWVDSSKIKRNIMKYRDKLDDFDLL